MHGLASGQPEQQAHDKDERSGVKEETNSGHVPALPEHPRLLTFHCCNHSPHLLNAFFCHISCPIHAPHLLLRSLKFTASFFEGRVPTVPVDLDAATAEQLAEFGRAVGPKVEEYVAAMEKIKLREGMRIMLAISAEGNKFLQDTKVCG